MSESKQDRYRRLNKQIARLAPADAASMRDEIERLQARVAELESDEQEMSGDNNV